MKLSYKLPSNRGFTLLELLIVIAIIGILLSVGFAAFMNAQKNARDQRRAQDLDQVKIALEQYFDINHSYPTANASGQINDPSCTGPPLEWGAEAFACGGTTYMRTLPKDPTGTVEYCYETTASVFSLYAKVENPKNATENPTPPFSCGGATEYDYFVTSTE